MRGFKVDASYFFTAGVAAWPDRFSLVRDGEYNFQSESVEDMTRYGVSVTESGPLLAAAGTGWCTLEVYLSAEEPFDALSKEAGRVRTASVVGFSFEATPTMSLWSANKDQMWPELAELEGFPPVAAAAWVSPVVEDPSEEEDFRHALYVWPAVQLHQTYFLHPAVKVHR